MTKEITLQDLIDKVKADLFSAYKGTAKEGKQIYPIFFVDQVELELAVNFTYEAETGLKISILQVLEGGATGKQGKEKGHTMKISLSPILSREELRAELEKDEKLMEKIKEASLLAMRKGVDLAGNDD